MNLRRRLDGILGKSGVVLVGAFFMILASKLFLISQYGSWIPFWDQWDGEAMNLLIPYMEGSLGWGNLLSPHNEHRISLTRLLVLVLFWMNGQWDPVVTMVVQAILHAAILGLFLGLLRSVLVARSWYLLVALTVLMYWVPFSWNNTLWGFQSQFYFVLLCGLTGIWLTWRFPEISGGWWIGFSFLLLGNFAMGNAILAPAAVLGVGLVRALFAATHRGRALLGMAATLVVVILSAVLLVNHPGHEPLKAQNISEFLSFFFKLAAWPTELPVAGFLLHLPVLAIGVFVLVRRPPRHDPAWFLATMGAWSTLAMAALAYGRANSGLDSRYTDGLALGLLISLASALYLGGLAQSARIQWTVRIATALGVAIAAGGLFHLLWGGLMAQITARKALEPIQRGYLLQFLCTDDIHVLQNKPFMHIPYPSAERLAQILRHPSLQAVLPEPLHRGIVPLQVFDPSNAFMRGGGTYPTTPQNPCTYFGSYSKGGDTAAGELRLDLPAIPSAKYLALPLAGYPAQEGMSISLVTASGEKIFLPTQDNPKEEWQPLIFQNPGGPFSLVAVDGSPNFWLAVGLPVPVGRLSWRFQWILQSWRFFGVAGVGLFLAGALFALKANSNTVQ